MKFKLECLECGRIFTASDDDPRCPKCNGVDYEVLGFIRSAKESKKQHNRAALDYIINTRND